MLENISWKEFAVFVTGGCAAYYGILLATGRLKLTGKSGLTRRSAPVAPASPAVDAEDQHTITTKAEKPIETEFETLELLADELQVIITQSRTENAGREELMESLRKEIARYPVLNKPAFRGAITNLIIKTARQELDMEVSRQEAAELWFLG